MLLDTVAALSLRIEPVTVDVDRSMLRNFAAAIGETREVYFDHESAHRGGHRDIVAAPTFLFSVELHAPRPLGYLEDLGIDLRGVLHGEQTFTHIDDVCAGDRIECRRHIASATEKSGMGFVVKHTDFIREGRLVATGRMLTIARPIAVA